MASEASTMKSESWVHELPASGMVYPQSWTDRFKYVIWRLYTPMHPAVRDFFGAIGLINHTEKYPRGRQPYILGHIAPGQTLQEFVTHVVGKGFGNHFVAFEDRGQVVSLRRVTEFAYQYHLRVFEDGEVRGHYEYTPECHPFLHMKEGTMEPRREEFLAILGDKIVVAEHNE
jgi:hypothetical protein